MAEIWPVYEGRSPTLGAPWAELPVSEAISLFELRPEDFTSDLDTIPRFGDASRDLWYFGFKHVVVEIGPSEAKKIGWQPGFYRSQVRPEDAFGRLIKQALASELGAENVVRVKYEPATDSQGRDALAITVVIAPGAIRALKNGVALDALVQLQKRLRDMREERTPIIQYVTEAELAQDGGR